MAALSAGRRLGWLLPLALLGTAALQSHMLIDYPAYACWLTPKVVGIEGAAALLLLAWGLSALFVPDGPRRVLAAGLVAGLGTFALLAAPAVWTGVTISGSGGGGLVAAGPAPERAAAGQPGRGTSPPDAMGRDDFGPGACSDQAGLVAFLREKQGEAAYLVATTSANAAAPIILSTGQPVMALGGFLGSDPILTADQLAAQIQAGDERFFLLGGLGGRGSNGLTGWVQSNCTAVPISERGTSRQQLYDCGMLPAGLR